MLSAIRVDSLAMAEQQLRYPNNYSRCKSQHLKGVNKGLFCMLKIPLYDQKGYNRDG